MDAKITVYNGLLVLEAYRGCSVVPCPRRSLGVSPEAMEWIKRALVREPPPPANWLGDGYVEWSETEFKWPGGKAIKVWRSLDAFMLHPQINLDLTRCLSTDNDTSEEAKERVDSVQIVAREIAGYIITYAAFDYNDEYYTEESGYTIGFHLYSTKGDAEKVAREANRNHVLEVLGDIGSWTYGEGLSSQIREDASADELRRFAFILGMPLPEDKSMEEVEEYIDSAREVEAELTEDDLDFLLDMWPSLHCAHVEMLYKA